jgi:hypothetical protein
MYVLLLGEKRKKVKKEKKKRDEGCTIIIRKTKCKK